MKYHALFVIFKKRQNLKLLPAANYRWRFKGQRVKSNLGYSEMIVGICFLENL